MLAIQYPWRYASMFEELCDFHVLDMTQDSYADYDQCIGDKECWGDFSVVGLTHETALMDGVILPTFDEPGRHLLNQARMVIPHKTNIGIWVGEKKHLELLEAAVDIVALPHYVYGRANFISRENAPKYHAYEFCNLDELRRYPYRSLHTSVPITAALIGIDLRTRERRPKRLPVFSYDLLLNEAQLELAVSNCKAIKEAMEYARRDNSSHT